MRRCPTCYAAVFAEPAALEVSLDDAALLGARLRDRIGLAPDVQPGAGRAPWAWADLVQWLIAEARDMAEAREALAGLKAGEARGA